MQAGARAKFDETVEISLRLGIDPRRGDQMVRGATMLPHGTGKAVRVCVFAKDEAADAAKAAGGGRGVWGWGWGGATWSMMGRRHGRLGMGRVLSLPPKHKA